MLCFDVDFELADTELVVTFDTDPMLLSAEFENLFEVEVDSSGYGTYKGDYVVDPDWDAQKLDTKNKKLSDDITVNAIELQRVSNAAGGCTVYIGGLIDG